MSLRLNAKNGARGAALAEHGDPTAEKEFRATIAGDPRNGRAYNNLGNVLRAMNRDAEAAEAYGKAIELVPRYADPLNGLGALLLAGGRVREAIPYFDSIYIRVRCRLLPAFTKRSSTAPSRCRSPAMTLPPPAELQRLLARLPASRACDSQRVVARTLLGKLSPQFRR